MKVSLKDDHMPDGTELHVRGLGMLVNGKTVEFSEEAIKAFEAYRGEKIDQAFRNDKRIKIVKGGDGD